MPHSDRRTAAPRDCRQSGFTLLEVLIAILILSVGVLGAVGMQAKAMQANKEVRFQAAAGTLARELAEKMRGNHAVATATTAAANPYLLDVRLDANPALTVPAINCATMSCPTGLNMANWDIYDWQLRAAAALPSPRVRICMDSDPFDAAGRPRWACSNTGTVAMLKVAWISADASGNLEFTAANTTLPMLVIPLTAGSTE